MVARIGVALGLAISIGLPMAAWQSPALQLSPLEALGFVTAGWAVWLAVKQNIWNWPSGIASNIIYFVIFFQIRLFADMSLQVVFALISAYGWFRWLQRDAANDRIGVGLTPRVEWFVLAPLVIAATLIWWRRLEVINDSAPFLDALVTALSLAAQYLLSRKYLENWWLWIVVNLISVPLYFSKGLTLTAILYALYLAMNVVGLRDWTRERAVKSREPAVA